MLSLTLSTSSLYFCLSVLYSGIETKTLFYLQTGLTAFFTLTTIAAVGVLVWREVLYVPFNIFLFIMFISVNKVQSRVRENSILHFKYSQV